MEALVSETAADNSLHQSSRLQSAVIDQDRENGCSGLAESIHLLQMKTI